MKLMIIVVIIVIICITKFSCKDAQQMLSYHQSKNYSHKLPDNKIPAQGVGSHLLTGLLAA